MSALEIDKDAGTDEVAEDEEGAIRLGDIYIPPPYKPPVRGACDKRLVMVQIVNNNFKSFYGTVTLGPFHEKFTAIIGPNGSGKSNVIDALMFVFGSRANRIRSKKLSTLIHNSAQYKDLKSCSVDIHYKQIFNVPGGFQDVPDSEIVISRTVCKDNSSYYKLNNQKVPFKIIFNLFKSHGIDLEYNRFLILQGEVEQISLMRNKARNEHETGMLEFLEDIIGTSRYNSIIKKLELRVEELELEKSSKREHAEIVEKELSDSKKPRDKAIAFYRAENEIAVCKNSIYQKKLLQIQQSLKKVEEKRDKCWNQITEINEKLKSNESEKNELENQNKVFKKEYSLNMSKLNKLDEEFNKANNDDITKGAESKIANKNRKSIMEKIQISKLELEKLKDVPKNNTSEIEECEKKIVQLNSQLEKETQLLEECKSKISQVSETLIAERNELQTKLKPLKQTFSAIENDYNMLRSKLKLLKDKENQKQSNFENKKAQLENSEKHLEEKNSILSGLKDTTKKNEEELAKLQPELQNLSHEAQKLNSEIQKNNNLLQEYRDANKHRSRGRVLDFLRNKRDEGVLPGLFGRLGDLGGIDRKYDVAISTACGALENILVDNISTGQKCVELLREYDIGRATFIALDKQQYLWEQIRRPFHSPENLPRLFDLVRVQDDRIRPAFYYALRDTLVARDLDQAARVAYGHKRYRVITTNGELIETTGTLSGGGNRQFSGLMSEQVSERTDVSGLTSHDLDKAEQERSRLEEALQQCLKKKDFIQDRVNSLRQSIGRDRQKHNEILRVIKPIIEECAKLKEDLKLVKIQTDPQISELVVSVESKKKELDAQQILVDEIEVVLNSCKEKITSSVGSSVRTKQTKVNNLKKDIAKFQAQVTTLKIAIKNNEKKITMTESQIKTMETEVENCKSAILTLHTERSQLEETATRILAEKEELEKNIKDLKEKSSEIVSKIKDFSKKESSMKSQLIEYENELKTFQEKIKIHSRDLASYNSHISKLSLNDISLTDKDPETFKTFSEQEIAEINIEELNTQISTIEKNIKTEKLEPNLTAIKMYTLSVSRHEAALVSVSETAKLLDQTRETSKDLKKRRLHEFMLGFSFIAMKCKKFYRMLSIEGDAELELIDETNPFTSGIVLNIRPPKKSWKAVMNLSGGEKTLASLSFVFAVHHYRPSPLYLMDEIDAALDSRNVTIVGYFILAQSANTQFIIISLCESMFRLSERLVGIYKVDDCSGTVVVANGRELKKYLNSLRGPPRSKAIIVENLEQGYEFCFDCPSTSAEPEPETPDTPDAPDAPDEPPAKKAKTPER